MGTQAAAARSRRSDAGQARLTERDITGLLLVAEQYAAPYDLLAEALGVTPARVRAITARWRGAGYAVTGVLGPGPAWCWLTPAGMAASGHPWPARPPSLSRLAHVRAVLAARLWLQAVPAYAAAGAWWRCERSVRAALPPPRVGTGHVPDAEVHWPSVEAAGPHAGATWADRSRADAEAVSAHRADHGRAARPALLRAGHLPGARRPRGRS